MATHAHTTPKNPRLSVTRVTPGRLYACPFPPRSREARRRALHSSRGPHHDAMLISLCAEFDTLERGYHGCFNGAHTDAEWDRAEEAAEVFRQQQQPVLNLICAIPCTTMEGAAALAASLVLWADLERVVGLDDRQGFTDDRLCHALLWGLLAGRTGV